MPARLAPPSLTPAALACLAAVILAGVASRETLAVGAPDFPQVTPAAVRDLPLLADYRYSLSAEAWPILWARKDSIGGAMLRHRAGPDGIVVWEVAGGTDPTRAPLRFNYWLYVRERVSPAERTVLSVTRDTDDRTIDEARRRGGREASGATTTCKSMRSTFDHLTATTVVERLTVARSLTFRDLDQLPALLQRAPATVPVSRVSNLPAGTQGGLPMALVGLMTDTAAWYRAGQPLDSRPDGRSRPYLHEGKLYDITLERTQPRPRTLVPSIGTVDLIKGRFVIRNRANGARNAFDLEFGASGRLACIPVRIVVRPRWWLKLELALE